MARGTAPPPQLQLRGVTKRFGSFVAVNNLDLDVQAGERKAIIGPNGAGKTTLFNLISGLLAPTAGKILLEGEDVTHMKVHTRARRGLGRSFQVTSILPRLSVYENVRVAAQAHSPYAWDLLRPAASIRSLEERTLAVLEEVGLLAQRDLTADVLSHGDRRLLDLAMALVVDPKLLLLDEPTAGMSPQETTAMAGLISRLAQERTVILVEHDMEVVMSLSTSILVLARGARLAEGTPDEIQRDQRVQEAYLGGLI